jgi:hypothetical protein
MSPFSTGRTGCIVYRKKPTILFNSPSRNLNCFSAIQIYAVHTAITVGVLLVRFGGQYRCGTFN